MALLETPMAHDGVEHDALADHLARWREADLPDDLRPPEVRLDRRAFLRPGRIPD